MIVGSNILAGASGQQGYFLNRSVRLRSSASAYFARTFTTPTNNLKWTCSAWVKRGKLGTAQTILGGTSSGTGQFPLYFTASDQIAFYDSDGASTFYQIGTTAVFRDPSAWYHIVMVFDSANATQANRLILYVNGVSQTLSSIGGSPGGLLPLNRPSYFNAASAANNIGCYSAANNFLDGYLTEINFIDGQALTPTSFGEYNTITGVWQPKKYGGTYGTNGFYLPFNLQNTSSYAAAFNGTSQYLTLNGQSAFTLGNNSFTIETWVYPTTASQTSIIYDGRPNSTQGAYPVLYLNAGAISYFLNSTNLINGTSLSINQWHHVAVVRNGTTTTLYLDGVSQGSATDTTNYLSGGASRPAIGVSGVIPSNYFSGLLSNLRVVNGTAVYTSNFVPSSVPLTAITNTALLTLQNATIIDNSTNAFTIINSGSVVTALAVPFTANIGADASGNNNNWYANNINVSTLGTTFDSMTDVPTLTSATTANYAVMNPTFAGTSGVLNGNLDLGLGSTMIARSSILMTTGKWYAEFTMVAAGANSCRVGITGETSTTVTNYLGSDAVSWGYTQINGVVYNNSAAPFTYASYTNGDIIGVAYDADARSLSFYKNNSLQGTITSANITAGNYYFAVQVANSTPVGWACNFGQRPFSYTPPTGFKALNTYNLPTPTIKNGANQFAATIFTATGTTQSITNTVNGASFQPDLLIVKTRAIVGDNNVIDSVRGVSKYLITNTTGAELTAATFVTSFNSNGWTFGTGNYSNGTSLVGWQWKASNAAAVTNTAGSISSQVSANPSAGFSIVTYTGNGSAGATVGHGLGVAPSWIILKNTSSTQAWTVGTAQPGGWDRYMTLNSTAAATLDGTVWNTTNPTSSVFTLGTSLRVNGNGGTYVAYCFSEIAGYSKFGSYTGNGSTNGTFVYTGFRPRFLMIKNTSSADDWVIIDTSRATYNVAQYSLSANTSAAEASPSYLDILSNGFKIRQTFSQVNSNGSTYIYAAFCESSFNYSLAR